MNTMLFFSSCYFSASITTSTAQNLLVTPGYSIETPSRVSDGTWNFGTSSNSRYCWCFPWVLMETISFLEFNHKDSRTQRQKCTGVVICPGREMENKTYLGLLSQQVKETITTDSIGGGLTFILQSLRKLLELCLLNFSICFETQSLTCSVDLSYSNIMVIKIQMN